MIAARLILGVLFCVGLLLISLPAPSANLPEVFIDSVTATQTNRLADWIDETFDDHEARLDTLEADRDSLGDTLHDRIDSTQSDIDTCQLEIDTLRIDVDTLELAIDSCLRTEDERVFSDSMFWAYDVAGDQSITAGNTGYLLWDSEFREDGIYGHTTDHWGVCIKTAGDYEVTVECTFLSSSQSATWAGLNIDKYNSGWSAVSYSYSAGYIAGSSTDYACLSATVPLTVSANDSIRIAFTAGAGDGVKTSANTARLKIEKKF